MSQRKTKQIDIARAAGVGRSTVSMILSGQETRFSPEIIKKVKQADLDLGYSLKKKQKVSLKKKKAKPTDIIYCIKRKDLSISNLPEFYTKIAFLLEEVFSKHGKTLILKNISDMTELLDYVDSRTESVAGVILHGGFSNESIALIRNDLPAVSILVRESGNYNLPLIELDNEDGMFKIASYLLGLGHVKVAYMGVVPGLRVFEQRLNGFLLAVRKLGMDEVIPYEEINKNMTTFFQAEEYARLFFDYYEKATIKPTAVMCGTSAMAAFLIKEAEKRNIQVPDDLSVTGFDDLTISMKPPKKLTTISTPIDKVCKMSAALIELAGKGIEINGMLLRIPCEQVVGGDTTSKVRET